MNMFSNNDYVKQVKCCYFQNCTQIAYSFKTERCFPNVQFSLIMRKMQLRSLVPLYQYGDIRT